jgi:cysteine and glycine-rich protein
MHASTVCACCQQSAYAAESVDVDQRRYHRGCFKCATCNVKLSMANFILVDGGVYCRTHGVSKTVHVKPHVDARANFIASYVRETSGVGEDARASVGLEREASASPQSASPNARKMNTIAMLTRSACARCGKAAYPIESVDVDGVTWHKACFKCKSCACTLTMSTFVTSNGELYCRKDVPKTKATVGVSVVGAKSTPVSPARVVAVAVAPIEPDVCAERAATDAIDGAEDQKNEDQDEDDEKSDAIAEDVVDVDAKTPMVEITNDAEPVMRDNALFEKNAGDTCDVADDEAVDAADELAEHIAEVKVAPAPNGKKKKKNRGGRK